MKPSEKMYHAVYMDVVYTRDEAQHILKMGKGTILSKLNRGELQGYREGSGAWRIPAQSIEEYIDHRMLFQQLERR